MTTPDDWMAVLERDPSAWPAAADWLTENGHDDLSYAVRWCGRRGRWPERRVRVRPVYMLPRVVSDGHSRIDFRFDFPSAVVGVSVIIRRFRDLVSEFPPDESQKV